MWGDHKYPDLLRSGILFFESAVYPNWAIGNWTQGWPGHVAERPSHLSSCRQSGKEPQLAVCMCEPHCHLRLVSLMC